MPAVVALVALFLVGCYDPQVRDCTVSCLAGERCAEGQVCGADGFCAAPSVAGRCASVLDAEPGSVDAVAAITPDASAELCAQGCTAGTCDGGTCVIDCSAAGSCTAEVVCPINLPCRVLCGNDGSCPARILCTDASSCEVICSGANTCLDEIRCGVGPCDITCSGDASCPKKNKCAGSCRCDVECSGVGSCADGSECPGAGACALGFGCTGVLAGCDNC